MLKEFIASTAKEAFLVGGAGTGKTTKIKEYTTWLTTEKITFLVCAYTHKAKDVLIQALPDMPIVTLHGFLKKRPNINSKATDINNLLVSRQYGEPQQLSLLIVDEFSFVGITDYEILKTLNLKVLYVGDSNQLNPVGEAQGVVPHKPYYTKLTKVYRQSHDCDLHITLDRLASMIENGDIDLSWLQDTDSLKLVPDIVDIPCDRLLAYTNKTVQYYNKTLQGYDYPKVGDKVNIPTLNMYEVKVTALLEEQPDIIVVPQLPFSIDSYTKFNPLKTLKGMEVTYIEIADITIAMVFGSSNYQAISTGLGKVLTNLNKLNKNSKGAYKKYKTFSDYVCNVDFIHATTIHKAQGSEWNTVNIDYQNLIDKCINQKDKVRLLYVAISRAKISVNLRYNKT